VQGSVAVGEIDGTTDWTLALQQCTVVVHLAARVHIMNETVADPLAAYRRTNVEGTMALARQAAAAGVRRVIFISTVKVNGESSPPGQPFRADDVPAPQDPYGRSKMEAEQGLRQLAAQTGLQVVIIRPPLVYGPGVGANFAALLRAVRRGLPLPLGAIHNQRSLVALDNLVDLIITCVMHPAASNQTFLVSDGQDLSTSELVRAMGRATGVSVRLPSVPVWALCAIASVLGKRDVVGRLCNNLQLDIAQTRSLLGWVPVISVHEGLRRAVSS
jgi:nucleoside-diphosphate-sugar epimerase